MHSWRGPAALRLDVRSSLLRGRSSLTNKLHHNIVESEHG
jgi:hypothetical protein